MTNTTHTARYTARYTINIRGTVSVLEHTAPTLAALVAYTEDLYYRHGRPNVRVRYLNQ